MIILDMNNKPNPVHVKSNHFIAENNILTLEVKLVSGSSDYDLTGKAITAIFQDKPMTQTLNVIDGLIQVPITNDLLKVGLNQLQLVINYDGAQELSPIMIMVILTSLIPAGPDEPSLNILSALINQINDVHNEEDIRIENEDIRIATQEEWTLIELQRQSAESTRNGNEITRLDSESDRATNEQARVSKESERVTSETARGTAETGRVTAEGSRVTAESSRVSAETNRATFYDGFNAQLGETDQRIDTLITTPVPVGEIIAQEIIDARQGALSVGANLTEVKSDIVQITDFENQSDFVDLIQKNMKFTELSWKSLNGSNLPRIFEVILSHSKDSKHITYRFDGNSTDDYIIFTDGYLGTLDGMNLINMGEKAFTSRTGVWTDLYPPNVYTSEVGATVRFDFEGTGFDFLHYKNNQGGVWKFVVDDRQDLAVELSLWSAEVVTLTSSPIFRDLEFGKHKVIATFMGADPLNPPTGTARGWMQYYPGQTYANPSKIYDNFPTNTKVAQPLYGSSNKDFALAIKPAGSALSSYFIPMHNGIKVTFNIAQPQILVDGKLITNQTFIGHAKECKLIQRCYAKHPDHVAYLMEITTIHTISVDTGAVEITGKIKFLQNTDVSGYANMIPVPTAFAKTMFTSINNTYDLTPTTGSTDMIEEKDKTQSYIFLNDTMKNYALAVRVNDIRNSFRQGQTGRYNADNGSPLWIEHRGTILQKIYPNIFKFHTALLGDIYKWGATYMVGDIQNIYDLI